LGKIRVIPNGVDVDHFAPGEPGAARTDPFRFAIVGRLEPRKGVDLAISALTRVPNATLDVVGDGESRAELEASARMLGVMDRVRFHGAVDDVRPLVADADAVVCSSRTEGLGIALLEAMAMGIPVVGFAVGGVPESVVHGVTGLLAPEGDVEALAARMRDATASRDRVRTMGEAARARVVERFSSRAMCEAYAREYEILARR
jgi:type III pantothenate kinase